MLNRVILIGRLTRDPELRYTPAGVAVTQFTLAVDRPFTGQGGEREADFIPVVTWRQLAETCANYLRKGRLTAVEGRIQVRNYENNEGKRVYVTEVIADNVRFLESNRDSSGGGGNREESSFGGGSSNSGGNRGNNNNSRNNQDPFSDEGKPIDISDDDLPF
ncbi:single-strand binding protein [Paenibacillus uliginis N3/975]|uniref:Single-stranded DNA-binding protein n=1 Tax=Paenibacillus uliginis N3/975 TaxID=1313296 RepID=A0A1X7HUT0_9BACL|nr:MULTISPECIES: single-stranded DNA-binding protein [Paenibacillus]UNK18469.1 single-stranded DNA-binding protein [Paenibacillus sp. N3/727]SMF92817.1 single-strand binding protein [Paenibacillus uliginis N3/975]